MPFGKKRKRIIVNELLEELRKIDEVTLLELLEVTSEEIIDAFLDRIVDNKEKLYKYVQE